MLLLMISGAHTVICSLDPEPDACSTRCTEVAQCGHRRRLDHLRFIPSEMVVQPSESNDVRKFLLIWYDIFRGSGSLACTNRVILVSNLCAKRL